MVAESAVTRELKNGASPAVATATGPARWKFACIASAVPSAKWWTPWEAALRQMNALAIQPEIAVAAIPGRRARG